MAAGAGRAVRQPGVERFAGAARTQAVGCGAQGSSSQKQPSGFVCVTIDGSVKTPGADGMVHKEGKTLQLERKTNFGPE